MDAFDFLDLLDARTDGCHLVVIPELSSETCTSDASWNQDVPLEFEHDSSSSGHFFCVIA